MRSTQQFRAVSMSEFWRPWTWLQWGVLDVTPVQHLKDHFPVVCTYRGFRARRRAERFAARLTAVYWTQFPQAEKRKT